MNTAKTLPLALVPALFLTALLPLAAKAQPLDPADFQVQSFPAGNDPQFLAFDGANIWVTNSGDDTVTKLRASDGTNLGTFPVGTGPLGIIFDGANIWVANYSSANVTKLRAPVMVLCSVHSMSAPIPGGSPTTGPTFGWQR
jgi:DNA-binding beta-propeller fold protein YncE